MDIETDANDPVQETSLGDNKLHYAQIGLETCYRLHVQHDERSVCT